MPKMYVILQITGLITTPDGNAAICLKPGAAKAKAGPSDMVVILDGLNGMIAPEISARDFKVGGLGAIEMLPGQDGWKTFLPVKAWRWLPGEVFSLPENSKLLVERKKAKELLAAQA